MQEPTIYFKKSRLQRQDIVVLEFQYSAPIYTFLKSSGLVLWSDQLHKWYLVYDRDQLNTLYTQLKQQHFLVNIKAALPPMETNKGFNFHNLTMYKDYRSYLIGLRMSVSTVDTYSNFIMAYVRYLGYKDLLESDAECIRDFILHSVQRLNYSVSTHRQMVSAFKHLGLLYPELETLLEVMKRPTRDKFQPQVLSTQEVILLLQVTENLKHRFALGMLYSCGLRIGELLNMHLSHIDLDRQQVFVKHGKGRKDRHVSIAVSMFPLIKNYLATYRPETYVLESLSGGPYSSSSIRSFLRRSCKKAGITKKITPHSLRHSYATHMIENGVGLRHVQELLGHSKPETTMLYTHIARKDLLQIVNPLDAAVKTFKSTKEPPNIRLSGDF